MPAIPIIGLGIGAYSAYQQAKNQGKIAKAQTEMMNRQSGLANEVSSMGKGQMQMGQPAMQKAMQYYMTLAGGGRGAMNAAMAPERGQMAESYRGAEQGMMARMAPGASRDKAIAEMYRSKAGQMGTMPFMARQNAMGQLAGMGGQFMDRGANMMGTAGNILSGASSTGSRASDASAKSGSAYGDLITQGTKMASSGWDWWSNRQGGGGYNPNTPTMNLNALSTWKGR